MARVYGHGCSFVHDSMAYNDYRRAGFKFAVRHLDPADEESVVVLDEVHRAHSQGVDMCFAVSLNVASAYRSEDIASATGEVARGVMVDMGAPHSVAVYLNIHDNTNPLNSPQLPRWLMAYREALKPYRTGISASGVVPYYVRHHFPGMYVWDRTPWGRDALTYNPDIMSMDYLTVMGVPSTLNVAYSPFFGQWAANPANQPRKEETSVMSSGILEQGINTPIPVDPGSAAKLMLYADIAGINEGTASVRVRFHSAAGGYYYEDSILLSTSEPVTIHFTERDTDGVMLEHVEGTSPAYVTFLVV
jgi:hypothetical protein